MLTVLCTVFNQTSIYVLIQIARNSALPNLTAHLTTLVILKRLAYRTIVECQVCVADDKYVIMSRSSYIVDL